MRRIYLDHNASSPLRPEARAAMLAALEAWGNPSSIHAEGRAARVIVEDAREIVARSMDVPAANVVFTSGGTEAVNAAIHAARLALGSGAQVIASATEHACALRLATETLPVDADGVLDMDALNARLACGRGVLAVQIANNETGVQQPYPEIAKMAREHGWLTVCDAVQAAGRIGVDAGSTGADFIVISAHKFGGPKGAGAIVLGRGDIPFAPLLQGGGQERGRRGGSENAPAIVGMAAALQTGDRDGKAFWDWAFKAQGDIEAGIRAVAPAALIFGEGAARLPHTTCFAVPGLSAETLLMAFDLEGIAVSSGSACSSGKVAPSHVLAAMGIATDLAKGAIRVSTGWNSTDGDIERFLEVWDKIYKRLRGRAAA